MRALVLLVALSSLAAVAQEEPSPPPVLPAEGAGEAAPPARRLPGPAPRPAPEAAPRESDASYLERCFAVPAQV